MTREMTQEELEFMQRHPLVPEKLVPSFLADLKRGRAIKEGARLAAERGIITRAVPLR